MGRPYVVVTDAAADFLPGEAEKKEIRVIPMEVNMGDHSFFHYADYRFMDLRLFYQQIHEGAMPKTSQITPQQYTDFFVPLLNEGYDILYLAFSSGMSGTCNSACLVANELKEKFPENEIKIIDSLGATGGQGLFVSEAAGNRSAGMTIQENAEWCEKNRLKFAYYWTVNDLMYLKRGGRVRAVSAYFGTALNLKPVGHIDDEGHLPALYRVRGRKASIRKMAEILGEIIEEPEGQEIRIFHSDCPEDAEFLKKVLLEMKLPVRDILTGEVGPIVGAHLGPGAVTLFYYAKHR